MYFQVGNSRYYNFDLSVNGTREKHGEKYPDDYLTDIVVSTMHTDLWQDSVNCLLHLFSY